MNIPTKYNKLNENNNSINSNKLFIYPNNSASFFINLSKDGGGINLPNYNIHVRYASIAYQPFTYATYITDNTFAYAFNDDTPLVEADPTQCFSPYVNYYKDLWKSYYKFTPYIQFKYPFTFYIRDSQELPATTEIYNQNLELINSFKYMTSTTITLQNGPQIIYILSK